VGVTRRGRARTRSFSFSSKLVWMCVFPSLYLNALHVPRFMLSDVMLEGVCVCVCVCVCVFARARAHTHTHECAREHTHTHEYRAGEVQGVTGSVFFFFPAATELKHVPVD
jgi:hypothetical protein